MAGMAYVLLLCCQGLQQDLVIALACRMPECSLDLWWLACTPQRLFPFVRGALLLLDAVLLGCQLW